VSCNCRAVTARRAVASIAAQGIMRGATATQFNPDAANTRGAHPTNVG